MPELVGIVRRLCECADALGAGDAVDAGSVVAVESLGADAVEVDVAVCADWMEALDTRTVEAAAELLLRDLLVDACVPFRDTGATGAEGPEETGETGGLGVDGIRASISLRNPVRVPLISVSCADNNCNHQNLCKQYKR